MKTCPNCKGELSNPEAAFCDKCGFRLDQALESTTLSEIGNQTDPDFVIKEASTNGPEFVGTDQDSPNPDIDFPIESTSDLMEQEANSSNEEPDNSPMEQDIDVVPIGQSEPPLPPKPDEVEFGENPASEAPEKSPDEPTINPPDNLSEKMTIMNPAETTGNDNHREPYLTNREKEAIIKKINAVHQPSESPPQKTTDKEDLFTSGPQPDLPSPKMAGKGKGIAHFYKSYIQLVGNHLIRPGDELLLNGRTFELKPKRIDTSIIVGIGAVLFVLLLFFIGSLFVSDGGNSEGEIIGIALDSYGQPYVQGATVRFPELNRAVESNPQGFFRSGQIPIGTHKLEYKIDGKLLKTDYATVTAGQLTTITLNPTGAHETNRPDVASVKSGKITQITDKNSESDKTGSSGHNKSTRTSGGSKKTKWASIALTVNIDGARLSLDGDVIGAGNLKYTKLKPGKHNYLVEARGFQPASGTIELTAGKTRRLQIILPPINQQMQLTSLAEDLLESGTSHLKGGDFQKAIDDFTEAINHQPGFAEAHMSRAQAYTWVPTPNLAYDDFIRAAEIYRAENNPNRAITAYNNALEIDRESLKAHLGRADQFLLNGEEIAAIVDYESALEIDKKNSQAHLGLGMARFQQANFRRAIRHFEDARSLDSKDPLAHQYLMLSYLAADDIENMKESFKEFQEVASEAELTRFQNDQEFSSVMEIINNE